MKNTIKLTLIILAILSVFMFISCVETSQLDSDSSQSPDNVNNVVISHVDLNNRFYPRYDLGKYYGSEFQIKEVGRAYYRILYNYEEARALTQFGDILRKEIFNENYILAIDLNLVPYEVIDFAGFSDFKIIDGTPCVTLYRSNTNKEKNPEVVYLAVPKEMLYSIWHEGYIDINLERLEYIQTKQILISNDFCQSNNCAELIKREELKGFIEENSLPILFETVKQAPSYLVCYSKGRFDTLLAFTELKFDNGKLSITKNYNLSNSAKERAFIDIIPIEHTLDNIKEVTVNSHNIANANVIREIKIDTVQISSENLKYYPFFDGGVYYGWELANKSSSCYVVINDYEELAKKTEKQPVDEEIFKENSVLIVKWNSLYYNSSLFYDLRVATQGITVKVDYADLFNESPLEPETSVSRERYSYLIVPKGILNSLPTHGYVNIEINEGLKRNEYYELFEKDLSAYGVKEGDAWYLSNNAEVEEFNKRYKTDLSLYWNKDFIVIYLQENRELIYDVVNVNLTKSNINLQLVRNITNEENNKLSPYLLIVYMPDNGDYIEDNLNLNLEILNLKAISYPSVSSMEYNPLSFKTFDVGPSNKVDFENLIITGYEQLNLFFKQYLGIENASELYNESIFEGSYILALYVEESHTGAIKKDFYNLRVGGDERIYIYATQTSSWGGCMICETLYLIEVPKSEEALRYKDVVVQETYDYVVSGPFEFETIHSTGKVLPIVDDFEIISSFEQLRALLENYCEYERLQSVDFEKSFILAFNRGPFNDLHFTSEYGDFVNFVVSPYGTASITFMYEPNQYTGDDSNVYTLDLVIIPKKHLTREFNSLTVVERQYPEILPEVPDKLEEIIDN